MKEINIEIITPSKLAFKGQIKSVSVPGSSGNFQVLFNHAPLLSTLEIGRIKFEDLDGNDFEFVISGGTIEVNKNKILILADSVETKEEIDAERAKRAFERAKQRLSSRGMKDVDLIRAEASLQRAMNRMKFVGAQF